MSAPTLDVLVGSQTLFVAISSRGGCREVSDYAMLLDIGYADRLVPVLAVPESPVPDGIRAGLDRIVGRPGRGKRRESLAYLAGHLEAVRAVRTLRESDFFASDGKVLVAPEQLRENWQVPIRGPLPEGLHYIR
jgi:hypothetical protein